MAKNESKYGSDRQMLNLVATLARLNPYPGEATPGFLVRAGRAGGWDLALPFQLSSLEVSLLETNLVGSLAFPVPMSRSLLQELDQFTDGTPILFRDAVLRGTDALYVVMQQSMADAFDTALWLRDMQKPRVLMRGRDRTHKVVIGFPFSGFFK